MTEPWQTVLRELVAVRGYATATLEALAAEIESGGARLVHGTTTDPPPVHGLRGERCAGACLVGFLEAEEHGWVTSDGQMATTAFVESWFGAAVRRLESHVWVHLGDFWDYNPDARALALAEVRAILAERKERAA